MRQWRVATDTADILGEGPLWSVRHNALFWFDIRRALLHRLGADGQVRTQALPSAGSAAAEAGDGSLLIAARDGFHRWTADGLVARAAEPPWGEGLRSNDGRVDTRGRFWIGAMRDGATADDGGIWILRAGAPPLLFRERVRIPNSIAFSPDGARAYFADSAKQTIWTVELDEEGSPAREPEIFHRFTAPTDFPDGSVVDARGRLWNAVWGGARLVCFEPDGRIAEEIALPVSQPTCPAFGGPNLDVLYVTSARDELSAEALAAEPLAGALLAVDVGAIGRPPDLLA